MTVRSISGISMGDQIRTSKTKEEYPISLTEAKRHLRVEDAFTEDDDLITDLIEDATEIIESYIEKDIALTNNKTEIFDFSGDEVRLYEVNYNSLTDVITDSSTLVEVNEVFPYYNYFDIDLSTNVSSNPLVINYKTGYSFVDKNIPKTLKRAILIKIGDLYDVEKQGYIFNAIKPNDVIDRLIAKYKSTIF